MRTEAASAGFYKSDIHGEPVQFPRLQILTVRELLKGGKVDMPAWHVQQTFKQAPKAKGKDTMPQSKMFEAE